MALKLKSGEKKTAPPLDELSFRSMFEKHAAVMLLIEPQSGKILNANLAAVNFYGYPKSKICSMSIDEINVLSAEQVSEEREKAVNEQRNYFIFTHKLASGEKRIVEVHSSPIKLKNKYVLFSIIHDVTLRKQVEVALSEGEEKFRSVIDYATNGITLTDEQGYVVEWNHAQANIFGMSAKEVLGQPLWDIQFQNIRLDQKTQAVYERIKTLFVHMLKTGEIPEHIREQEVKVHRPDGVEKIISSFVFSIKTEHGYRLAGISQDVTERRAAERSQKEALERLQKLTSRVPGVVYQFRLRPDGTSCFPFASEAMKEIYRVSPQAVREDSTKILNTIHPDDVNGVVASIKKSAEELSPWKYEYRVKFDDGMVRSLYGNSIPQAEEDGSVLWHGFMADITDRKQMEQEFQTQRDFATQIINLMGQGLTVTNKDGRFEFVNPAYASLFGYETAELIGKSPSEVTMEEDRGTLDTQRKLRKAGQTTSYESKLRRADGSIAKVLITGVPRVTNKEYAGAIAVITDVTERKEMEDKLQQQNKYLSILHQITLDLLNHRGMDELFQIILDRAAVLLDAPFVELMLEKDSELVVQTYTKNQEFLKGDRIGRKDATLSWQAFDTKQPAVLDDYSTYPHRRNIYKNPLHAVMDLPVIVQDKCIGVLGLGRSQAGYAFSEIQIKIGVLFSQLAALVLDNAQLMSALEYELVEHSRAENELRHAKDELTKAKEELEKSYLIEQHLARSDALTGINNRRSLFELAEYKLSSSMRYGTPLSLIMFDVDRFKYINDTFGHIMGDQALVHIAQTVSAELRSADIMGRYGGDEFIILLPQTSPQDALSLAERIHTSVGKIHLDFGDTTFALSVSIGITQARLSGWNGSPPDGKVESVESIILRADKALYEAKHAGQNRTIIFDPD